MHARTGFPVCVARAAGGALCPAGNRPADPNARRYTCGAVSAEALAPALPGCDPRRPAPLRVGDHVAYVGMLVPDPAGGFVVAAHGLEAEVGIYTSPGAEPVYVFIEEALMGTVGQPFDGVPQEETSRVRIVGFTTDPSRAVEVSLIDSGRNETGTSLTGPAGLTPSNAAQFGRFRNTWPAKDNARAVRRDVHPAQVLGSPNQKLASGLTSGVYVAPIGEYIAPEATRFGRAGFSAAGAVRELLLSVQGRRQLHFSRGRADAGRAGAFSGVGARRFAAGRRRPGHGPYDAPGGSGRDIFLIAAGAFPASAGP